MGRADAICQFLHRNSNAIAVELTSVRGSSPREAGALMLVAEDAIEGTIGGGQLEYLALREARRMLRDGRAIATMDVPLGPEIGQCCGGRVGVRLRRMDNSLAEQLIQDAERADARRPDVFVFGTGHVGHALVRALAPLPLRIHAADSRPEELQGLPEGVAVYQAAMPEALVRGAPKGASFVILTHDHALDFLIAFEALKRADTPYVGMVGSRTKRARYASWHRENGGAEANLRRLVLPIGSSTLRDKRPEVIAALAVAEILVHIGAREAENLRAGPETDRRLGAAVD